MQKNISKLSSNDKIQISNKIIESLFTHLSPDSISANAWKFVFCSIAAFQKTEHCRQFMSDIWNQFEFTNNNDVIAGVKHDFETARFRQVTLRMQDIANVSSCMKKKELDNSKISSKKYKRSDLEATCRIAAGLHITTNTALNSLDEWATYRSKTLSDKHCIFDSPLTDWFQWHHERDSHFVGYIFDSVEVIKDKPYVTVEFSIGFLQALFSIGRYTKLDLMHLSSFKSLAGLRLYQCLVERKAKIRDKSVTINHGVNWWRGFLGVADTVQATVTTDKVQPQIGKRTSWALSLLDGDKIINDFKVFGLLCENMSITQKQIMADSIVLIDKKIGCMNRTSTSRVYSILIEQREGQYQEFKKLNQNVLQKAIKEVVAYCSINLSEENFESASIIAVKKHKIKSVRCASKRKKGATTATSFWIKFEIE
ncbi:RepB family plasmid replication initiator protein [Shewanella sp. 125m-1]